jgi:hypothetical protein
MSTWDKQVIENIASTVNHFVQDAVGEIATCIMDDDPENDETFKAFIKQEGRPRDLHGAFADYLYNHIPTLRDFMGDRTVDEINQRLTHGTHQKTIEKYCEVMQYVVEESHYHTAYKEAAQKAWDDWKQ